MSDLNPDKVVDEFLATELVKIAEFVGLSPNNSWTKLILVTAIRSALIKYGFIDLMEKVDDDLRPIFYDFLYLNYLIDENNEPVSDTSDNEVLELEEYLDQFNITKPTCFTFADPNDPQCVSKCSLYGYCAIARIKNLPPCFGNHDPNAKECIPCTEAFFCKTKRRLTINA